jgi:hypothetical protein
MGKEIGGEEGERAHPRLRIWPGELADGAESSEVIPPIGGVSCEEEKRVKGEVLAFIGGLAWMRG